MKSNLLIFIFFAGDYFKDEVNSNNALGFNGKLAVSFAMLLKKMWMGTDPYLAPSKLRVRARNLENFRILFLKMVRQDM